MPKLLSFFCSIPLVIVLLSLLIVFCALGTFIPQGLPQPYYIQKYGQGLANLLSLLRVSDIYHSPGLITILVLLWVSLFICTLRQLKFWKKAYAAITVHFGLLVILIGCLITSIFGQRGVLMIVKGHSQDVYLTADNKFKKLGFKIYLDDFIVEWYDSSDKEKPAIKDFKSKVIVLNDGQAVLAKIIRVNHPLAYRGYTFCQASYDEKAFSWSGFEVSQDPGVGLVYAGFILLNIGAILIIYSRRSK